MNGDRMNALDKANAATRVSPLERRALLALVSLIRDRCEYWNGEWQDDFYHITILPRELYARMYVLKPDVSYERQTRNQRQAIRRALERLLKQGFISAVALGWCAVKSDGLYGEFVRWHGGGSRKRNRNQLWSDETPRWRMVGLDELGFRLALLLGKESAQNE